MILWLIMNLSSYWWTLTSGTRSSLWLAGISGSKLKSTANADVDFCSKMAALTAVMQMNRSGSSSSSKKPTRMTTQRRFRLIDNNVLLFLSLASMWHCALAGGKTLVLLDNLNIRDTHSMFFRSLAGQYKRRTSLSILLLSFIDLCCIANWSLAGNMERLGLELVDLRFMQHSRSANVSLAMPLLCSLCVAKLRSSFQQFNVF